MKLNKCLFAGSSVVYLGFVVSREGIAPDPQKVEAVRAFPLPHDVKSLRSFLVLASYYRHFVMGFSSVSNPLFILTKKDVDFVWSEACEGAFHQLKNCLLRLRFWLFWSLTVVFCWKQMLLVLAWVQFWHRSRTMGCSPCSLCK